MTITELRCPVGPRALLGKTLAAGLPIVTTPDNLVELACRDCKHAERQAGRRCAMVVHRYDIGGQLVETEILR